MKSEFKERFKKLVGIFAKVSIKLLPLMVPVIFLFLIMYAPKLLAILFSAPLVVFEWLFNNPIYIALLFLLFVLIYVFVPPIIKNVKAKSTNASKTTSTKKQVKIENKIQTEPTEETPDEEKVVKTARSRSAEKYEERSLLTPTEKKFYQYLMKNLDGYDVVVNPKVRLEDILKVVNADNRSELYKMRGYVKSRHIDFILCDSEMNLICGIEVDDDSHSSEQAKEIDEFKNDIFRKIHKELYRIVKMDKLEEGAKIIVNNLVSRKMIKKKTI